MDLVNTPLLSEISFIYAIIFNSNCNSLFKINIGLCDALFFKVDVPVM